MIIELVPRACRAGRRPAVPTRLAPRSRRTRPVHPAPRAPRARIHVRVVRRLRLVEQRRKRGPRICCPRSKPIRRPREVQARRGRLRRRRASATAADELVLPERLLPGRDVNPAGGRSLQFAPVAQHHHDRQGRPNPGEHRRQVDPVHLTRHLDVGHDEVHLAGWLRRGPPPRCPPSRTGGPRSPPLRVPGALVRGYSPGRRRRLFSSSCPSWSDPGGDRQ